jgi:hypothetical protein
MFNPKILALLIAMDILQFNVPDSLFLKPFPGIIQDLFPYSLTPACFIEIHDINKSVFASFAKRLVQKNSVLKDKFLLGKKFYREITNGL